MAQHLESMSKAGAHEAFTTSCQRYDLYPTNLVSPDASEFALERYNQKLKRDDGWKLFHPRSRLMWICDLKNDNKVFETPLKVITEDLAGFIDDTKPDPLCRLVFIQSPSSRSPLGCSRDQLAHLLTYNQVSPTFLDFVFTFRAREKPHIHTQLRYESRLGSHSDHVSLPSLGRSGVRIQHSFNLIGVELDESQEDWPWLYRQTACYFSFDLKTSRSLWITLKGNKIMRERMSKGANTHLQKHPAYPQSPQGSFAASLKMHILIFEWCVENWAEFVDFLDENLRRPTALTKMSPIHEIAGEEEIARAVYRSGSGFSFPRSRQNTNLSRAPNTPAIAPRVSTFAEFFSSGAKGQGPASRKVAFGETPTPKQQQTEIIAEDRDPDDIYSFPELQRLYRLSDRYDDAYTVVEQDKRALVEFGNYIDELTQSEDFKAHINMDQCQTDVSDFMRRLRGLIADFDSHLVRISALTKVLDRNIALFNGILQLKSNQTAEFFSKQAQLSADQMHEIAIETHRIAIKTEQETVSMHVITVFTLIFLPGTFVAVRYGRSHVAALASHALITLQTLFSSGILDFSDDTGAEFGQWNTRWGAIKLYLAICFPVMIAVLSVWGLMYYIARRAHKSSDTLPKEKALSIV